MAAQATVPFFFGLIVVLLDRSRQRCYKTTFYPDAMPTINTRASCTVNSLERR